MKVAAQAGVLQVWLDEAGIEFMHADGASGGTLNLAMYCQGMTGTQIANNWRSYHPLHNLQANWRGILEGPWGESLLRLDQWREHQLKRWGLDWQLITSSHRSATFNLYNFTRHELMCLTPAQMTPRLLTACISLPGWFPPVSEAGDRLIDSVYATDANLLETIRHGADELWVVWTVSRTGRWRNGWLADYFQIIEASANSNLKASLAAIDENNSAFANGRPCQFGRPITVRMLAFDVPLHYLLVFRTRQFRQAVDLGMRQARQWCQQEGFPTVIAPSNQSGASDDHEGRLTFHEMMTGHVSFNQSAALDHGASPRRHRFSVDIRIEINNMGVFLDDVEHTARVSGTVTCEALGGNLPLTGGRVKLLAQDHEARTTMRYSLAFSDAAGHPLRFNGTKYLVHDGPLDLWVDTTTLHTRLTNQQEDGPIAEGVLRLSFTALLRMMFSFRADGGRFRRLATVSRFLRFFLGGLARIYGVRGNPQSADGYAAKRMSAGPSRRLWNRKA